MTKRLVFGSTSIICFLFIPLLYADLFTLNVVPFHQWRQHFPYWKISLRARKADRALEDDSMKILLRNLVRGEDRTNLEATGFACDSTLHSIVCVADRPVRINTTTMTVHLLSNQTVPSKTVVKPYARQEDEYVMKSVSPVQILQENTNALVPCDYTHKVPAVIFSTSGFIGNQFHELDDIIIPLFLTSRQFKTQVSFIIIDYKPWFVTKYKRILSRLSRFEVINPVSNGKVHCFPGSVVGLKYHGNFALNASQIPGGYSMLDFKNFLKESYNLKTKKIMSKRERPVLVLISRRKTRIFLNEDEMVSMMEKLGFRVVIVSPKMMSNLEIVSKLVSTCSVLVGAHGAGLAYELFLPNGAVMVQVVPLGLEWPSARYFGEPANEMGVQYLEYKIEPKESSLFKLFGPDHPVIVDPTSVFSKGFQVGRAVYIEGQNMEINLWRFKVTLIDALKLLGRSYP